MYKENQREGGEGREIRAGRTEINLNIPSGSNGARHQPGESGGRGP